VTGNPVARGGGRVVVDITVSLDGYVTAPGADTEHGLGVDGEALHDWVFAGKSPADEQVLAAAMARTGAVIMGRHTFDVVDGPHGWNDEIGYGADQDPTAIPPVFVLTRSIPEHVRLGDRFRFVTDGVASAVAQAKAAAGDKDVVVMGGGATCHAVLAAGLADELTLHIAPLILGDGTPLFPTDPSPRLRLRPAGIVSTDAAHHVTYDVLADADAG
jgi:dihydrofolate reductase